MTIADWNKDPLHTTELDAFLKTKTGLDLLSVLDELAPTLQRGVVVDAVTANIELGRENGWRDCMTALKALRKEIELPTDPLKPDWGTKE